ncbi:histidine kinase HHK3 [Xylariaceae sp. FL1651]|nr:histidine kinase HHK3 [Xylariaceae sp. FL1651]
MASSSGQRVSFFPKADAAILLSKYGSPPARPQTVGPIYDPANVGKPIGPWSQDVERSFYPLPVEDYAPASIPERPTCLSDRYLRAFLSKNERVRLSMLWYYTRDIQKETEFLAGLKEKTCLAKESTGWEFVVIGILDMNLYIRLATIGLPLAILPRGETICAHTVTQPPGSVFLLPNMQEDWRFQESPYVELGGLRAYAGAPLRLQHESGDCVGLGSLCVVSSTSQEPLNKLQQQTIARLADWVVSDIIQCARARRQRERHRMSELISLAERQMGNVVSEEPILEILRTIYPDAVISLQFLGASYIEVEGRDPILPSDLEDGLWEDIEYLDDLIANANHQDLPSTRIVRIIAAQCESISGSALLVVASKDFRLVFDDIDSWFVRTCANMLSQMWHKHLLAEAIKAKEKFLRGFSHQLRTPIHGILGAVELLVEELKSRNWHKNPYPVAALLEATAAVSSREPSMYLDTIKTAGRDLISIVNSMITLNRWVDIATTDRRYAIHTIYELEAELESEIFKAISEDTRYTASVFFKHNLPPDCDSLRIDISLLRDSILPLIINAIQNTPEGIVVITVSIRPDSKELIVDIEDTGRGIHPDHYQRIFDLYEKVDMHSTGAGLGLALASKFAALLHGSVNLVSSNIGCGSHFRITFQDIKCVRSSLPRQPLVSKIGKLPSKFCNIASRPKGTSLSDYFAEFLTYHGFSSSDSIEDSFIILDFISDLEQRRVYISQIPSNQVAICLVPASEGETCFEQPSDNVIYVNAPFWSSTMSSALETADRRVSEINALKIPPVLPNLSSLTLLKVDADAGTDERTEPVTDSSRLKEWMAEPPPHKPADPGLDTNIPSTYTYKPDSTVPVESRVIVPIFPPPSSSKPTALLVDDNVVNLRIMQMYCSKRGLPYYCAADGYQAVKLFSQHQSKSTAGEGAAIELVLMDLQMPVCDGLEATRQIRQLEKQHNWRDCTLFIVTGQDSPADKIATEEAGADEYFVKPVGLKVLDRGVKQYFPAFEPN